MRDLVVRNSQTDRSWSKPARAGQYRQVGLLLRPVAWRVQECRLGGFPRRLRDQRRFSERPRRSAAPGGRVRAANRATACTGCLYLCLRELPRAAREKLRRLSRRRPHWWPWNRCKTARRKFRRQIPGGVQRREKISL